MQRPGWDCEVLNADEWKTLQKVRLKALVDSPSAYISTYDIEYSWTETQWRRSFADALWIVTQAEGRIIGVAHSLRVHGRSGDERHIESVWVDPFYRGKGVMRAMLAFLADQEPTVRDWLVWVLDTNSGARTAYEKLGFEPTGERQPLRDDSGRCEERLRLRLQQARTRP